MTDMPFLGCKISLISKCDIRYEGILYCVDAKESTIALSKVKSYGTETRGDPSNYVAPKNDIYDVIIFRASDVKDLRVDAPEPPGLSDPAIISAHHSYPAQSTSSFDNTNNDNNNTTTLGAPTLNSNGSLSTSGPSNQQHQKQQHHKPLLPFLPTGSKDHNQQHQQHQHHQQQPQQHQQQQPAINYSSAVANAQRRARPDPRDKRSDENKRATHDSNRDSRRDDRRNDKREDRRDDRRNDRRDDRRDDRRSNNNSNNDRRDDGRRGDNRSNARVSRGGYDGNRNHVHSNNRYNNNYNSRRGPNNRDDNAVGGNSYRRGPPPGNRRARSNERTGAPRGSRKSAPLKFEGEYDFDEANKLFLELESKFKGMKLKGEEKDGESSGDGANSKSPADPSESGSCCDSDDQNHRDGDSKDGYGGSTSGDFYDKSKSFFDNISCEASERSQGKVNKPDWRKERLLNAETFGVSPNYRRGGYRGRSYGANGYHRR